ncbi:MAG: hypothetical protein ABIK65_16305 [Candidatus Eisenbacteria bacterium]
MRRTPGILLALLVATTLSSAEVRGETILTAEIDRDTITVGDPILLTVGAAGRADDPPDFPVFPEGKVGPFEILESLPVATETREGVRTAIARFRITAFETGSFEIPAITPPGGGAGSGAIPVTVISVGVDPEGDLRDVKPPLSLGREWFRTLAAPAAAALLLAAALFAWLLWRRREILPDPSLGAVDLRPAHVAAYRALDALEEERRSGSGAGRPYWFRLSGIARDYIDRRYHVPAPERTSRETLRILRGENMDTETTGLLRELFVLCDLAKYRGTIPGDREAAAAAGEARRFVDLTRERGGKEGGEES